MRKPAGLIPLIPPILLAAVPVLTLFQQNETELPIRVLWVPLLISIAAAAVFFAIFILIFRDGAKAGALACLVALGFFHYGWIWTPLLILAAVLVLRTKRELGNLTLVLVLFAAVLALVPTVKIASYQSNHPPVKVSDSRLWPDTLPKPKLAAGAHRPDVYVLIPDDYERSDILKKYFHYDNRPFLSQLKKRGFAVSTQSRSPYSDSESNIAAALNMGYLDGLPRILGKKSQDVRPVKTLIEKNRAAILLESLGYRYIHRDTDEVTYGAGNPHISRIAVPDSFTNLWVQKSVLNEFGGRFGFNEDARNERFRKSIRSSLADLNKLPQQPGPKFVVFHTLLPHDPYIFGPQGQKADFDHPEDALGSKLGAQFFVQQSKFTEGKLLDATDAILAHDKKAIIVIQADEGFSANEETWGEDAMLDMRVKGLNAVYLPGVRGSHIAQPPNTVNTLRFVFNRYFGTQYPMLKTASYPELDYPYQFEKMRVK